MLTLHELLEEVDRLSLAEKWQVVKHIVTTLEQERIAQPARVDYHHFLHETYGVLRNTPIERWDQGEYEDRDQFA